MNFLGILKSATPFIAQGLSLGGPLGGIAGGLLQKAVGSKSASVEDLATAVVNMTPEQAVALKTAEEAFQIQMKQMDITSVEDMTKLSNDDRANARARQVSLKDWFPTVLASVVTAGFFSVLALVIFHGVPDSARDMSNILIGVLGTAWVSIIGYYFGTSAGSEAKTQLIADSKK